MRRGVQSVFSAKTIIVKSEAEAEWSDNEDDEQANA